MREVPRFSESLESRELFLKEQVIAHRGAAGYEPENTIRAFSKAIELGFTHVELDVWKSKDGKLVVIHDATVDRTTDGKGKVGEMNVNDIRSLKTKDPGGKLTEERVPLLNEVLDTVGKRARIIVELKGPKTAKDVAGLINVYIKEREWSPDDFMVTSFDSKQLVEFQKLNSSVPLGVSVRKYKAFLKKMFRADVSKYAEGLNAKAICISRDIVNKDIVDQIHKSGMRVFVYTVNTPEDVVKLKLIGVDMVFLDLPDKISR